MIDIVGKRHWFFIIAGAIILIGVVSLIVFGLKSGVEFSSGSILTVSFEQKVKQSDLNQELANLGYKNSIIQTTGEGDFLIRTVELTTTEKEQLKANLTTKFGAVNEKGFENVDPMVARQTVRTASIAIIITAVGMLLYITWAFRKMPNPFRYGISAIAALLHGVLTIVGTFSLFGAILGWEVNLMFITGILAVIGYGVNNTIIVFDRIRENVRKGVDPNFEVVVNNSLIESLGRCLNTTLTTLFVVLALLLFVGASIQNFVVVLLIGLTAGTFSSICIAPTLLVVWQKREKSKLLHPARA